ncbi:hypothetical protein [Nonlabens sp. Asnod3-H03]|uniref:hypothetical protein n=1 Tax=Nonlabens sp. Asnod3-H03 TaxID=3160580 RepID=UPI0038689EEA
MKNRYAFFLSFFLLAVAVGFAQGSSEYTGGMKVKLNEDGSKYFRIISWAQFWAQHSDNESLNSFGNEESDLNFSMRRARVLMYAQVSDKFLILTHFGLNSQNANNLNPVGKSDSSQLFFHDVWGQWSLSNDHAVGGGLHYWNGISRLNNQSTLNMLTLDNNRQSWATIGLSDQFARHMGVYFKGKFDRLQYRVAINEALTNGLDVNGIPAVDDATYNGREILGSKDAGKNYAGYFDYHFLDQESNFLPYKVGSYLGGKEVFNIGAGFFYHPNGSVSLDDNNDFQGEDVAIFAVDAFYDAPVGDKGAAITAYATYQNNDYGTNFTLGQTYETGSMLYGHVGYVLPSENTNLKIQPYLSLSSRSIDAIDDNATRYGIGGNLYLSGHNSKISLEYSNQKYGNLDAVGTLTLQAMIYL